MKEEKKYGKILCVCLGKKCKKKGAEEIYKKFRKSLKDNKNDLKVRIVKTKCLDHCDSGPIVIKDHILCTQFSTEDI
jgi:NADH:ubiquinone oxidoreductase subunit E